MGFAFFNWDMNIAMGTRIFGAWTASHTISELRNGSYLLVFLIISIGLNVGKEVGADEICSGALTSKCLADLALHDANHVDDNHWRGLAHAAIASAELEFGDSAGALIDLDRASASIQVESNKFNQVEGLIRIAVTQAELGEFIAAEQNIARAAAIADVIILPDWRYWALSFLPRAKAKTCAFVEAKESIEESVVSVKLIGDIVARASASTHIAAAQIEIGDPKGAIRTAERILQVVSKIDDEFWTTELLSEVALLQGRAGDIEGARASLARALSIAKGIDASWRNWRLAKLALVEAQLYESILSRERISDLVEILYDDISDESLAGWRTFAFAYLSKALAIVEAREAGRVPSSLLSARQCA